MKTHIRSSFLLLGEWAYKKRLFHQLLSVTFLWIVLFSFSTLGEEKVLDLGAIEIQGEVRRPNVQLVYSKKKYFKKTLSTMAKDELRAFEQELLKPAKRAGSLQRTQSVPQGSDPK